MKEIKRDDKGRFSFNGGPHKKSSVTKGFKSAVKRVESMGNAFDRNPNSKNETKLKAAIAVRDSLSASQAKVSHLEQKVAQAVAKKQAASSFIKGSLERTKALKARLAEIKSRGKKK